MKGLKNFQYDIMYKIQRILSIRSTEQLPIDALYIKRLNDLENGKENIHDRVNFRFSCRL